MLCFKVTVIMLDLNKHYNLRIRILFLFVVVSLFFFHVVSINVHPESVFDTVAICLTITQLASKTKNKDILYYMTSCIFN